MSQQSQDTFINTISKWNRNECLKNLDSALPAALSKLQDCAYISESIELLQVICRLFLPCIPSDQLEKQLFNQICPVTTGLIDSSLGKIDLNVKGSLKGTTEELIDVLIECFQWVMDISQCLELCLRHVSDSSPAIEMMHVKSLLLCSIHILNKSFSHCKESTDIYGDLVVQLSEPLSSAFKQAHSLQITLLKTLEKIVRSGPPLEDHVTVLMSICNGMFDLCCVVSPIDVKVAVSLWKGISRVCNLQLSVLRDRLDVCPMICFLCSEIQSGYEYLFELCHPSDPDSLSQGDDKAFSKSVKIVSFQMKVLVALLRDFSDYLGACEENVFSLLVLLLKHLPPCLTADNISDLQESVLRLQVVSATSPIIKHLLRNQVFRSALVKDVQVRDPDDGLPILLLQIMVLDVLPKHTEEIMDFWLSGMNHGQMQSSNSLLTAIFESFRFCYVVSRIPIKLPCEVPGKPRNNINLFEFVAIHLCGFIGACPSRHFSHLEDTLLHNVLCFDNLTSLLAIDCWCFVVRYGTASVCKDHVSSILATLTKLSERRSSQARYMVEKLNILLKRLVKFMSPKDQSDLLSHYPPMNHVNLWVRLLSHGGIKSFSNHLTSSITFSLTTWALDTLSASKAAPSNVKKALSFFTIITTSGSGSTQLNHVTPSHLTNLTTSLSNMWLHFHSASNVMRKYIRSCMWITELVDLTTSVHHLMDPTIHLLILDVLRKLISKTSDPSLCLSINALVCVLVKEGSDFEIPPKQNSVLKRVPPLICVMLQNHNSIVYHRVFETLKMFADNPTSAPVVEYCLQQVDSTKILQEWNEFYNQNMSVVDVQHIVYLRENKPHENVCEIIGGEREVNEKTEIDEETEMDGEESFDMWEENGKELISYPSQEENKLGIGDDLEIFSKFDGPLDLDDWKEFDEYFSSSPVKDNRDGSSCWWQEINTSEFSSPDKTSKANELLDKGQYDNIFGDIYFEDTCEFSLPEETVSETGEPLAKSLIEDIFGDIGWEELDTYECTVVTVSETNELLTKKLDTSEFSSLEKEDEPQPKRQKEGMNDDRDMKELDSCTEIYNITLNKLKSVAVELEKMLPRRKNDTPSWFIDEAHSNINRIKRCLSLE